MADLEATDDTPQLSDTDTSNDETDEEQIESLIAGRERRKTAGNRYDKDMVLEEAEVEGELDEVTLLFADNEEEDEEFRSSDGGDDADMSSSDDDDQGPNAAADDLEGEKDLQKQAKDERAKKRKADLALTSVAGLRKKLKADPTRPAVVSTQAKPSKRKERVTWVHDKDSGRSSLRKQTIAHRAETIARLRESEAQSKKLKALKEKRDRERAKDAPKELTQADRLAEAARIERQNAKSLNRWEESEKKRQEEQAAKLAALKNRKLEGPVVSWWSAKAKWIGPKLNKIGTKDAGDIIEGGTTEGKKRGRKSKLYHEQMAAAKNVEAAALLAKATNLAPATPLPVASSTEPAVPSTGQPDMKPAEPTTVQLGERAGTPPPPLENPSASLPVSTSPLMSNQTNEPSRDKEREPASRTDVPASDTPGSPTQDTEAPFLSGIHKYAAMRADGNATESKRVIPDSDELSPQPKGEQDLRPTPSSEPMPNDSTPAQPLLEALSASETQQTSETAPHISTSVPPPPETKPTSDLQPGPEMQPTQAPQPSLAQPKSPTIIQKDMTQQNSGEADAVMIKSENPDNQQSGPPQSAEVAPQPEPIVAYSTRNLVMLEKFAELSTESRREYGLFYNNRKTAKPVKHSQELCPFTTLPVRYRDSSTGIGYANVVGYKKLQELKAHKFAWSSMLGCYVGRHGGAVAHGVPEGFVGP